MFWKSRKSDSRVDACGEKIIFPSAVAQWESMKMCAIVRFMMRMLEILNQKILGIWTLENFQFLAKKFFEFVKFLSLKWSRLHIFQTILEFRVYGDSIYFIYLSVNLIEHLNSEIMKDNLRIKWLKCVVAITKQAINVPKNLCFKCSILICIWVKSL